MPGSDRARGCSRASLWLDASRSNPFAIIRIHTMPMKYTNSSQVFEKTEVGVGRLSRLVSIHFMTLFTSY